MTSFLHNFKPDPIMFSFFSIDIYWYGFFIVLAVISALLISLFLGKRNGINKDDLFDLFFYLIVFGLIGARVYDIFLELPHYIENPTDTFKIWQGGLAIHGGILAGIIVLWFFVKKKKIRGLSYASFWDDLFSLSFIVTPGLALAQSIGRWGNYFNQELFGLPTSSFWGIPIDRLNRPVEYFDQEYFHPTFLYESFGSFLIFLILIFIHFNFLKNKKEASFKTKFFVTATYFIGYSVLRFFLEFVRIDFSPVILGLRAPQLFSLIAVFLFAFLFIIFKNKKLI
jgi:phosphatidylglycerol---prolipoprotein diacylglyceryl transferase